MPLPLFHPVNPVHPVKIQFFNGIVPKEHFDGLFIVCRRIFVIMAPIIAPIPSGGPRAINQLPSDAAIEAVHRRRLDRLFESLNKYEYHSLHSHLKMLVSVWSGAWRRVL